MYAHADVLCTLIQAVTCTSLNNHVNNLYQGQGQGRHGRHTALACLLDSRSVVADCNGEGQLSPSLLIHNVSAVPALWCSQE